MSTWLLALVAGIYLAVAVDHYLKGNMGMVMVFVSYATSNLGLIWATR